MDIPDRVSVTTRQGWGSRLSESIKSVLFGVVLFGVAFPLLFWNEGRAVRTAKGRRQNNCLVLSTLFLFQVVIAISSGITRAWQAP